jgi:two-component system, response regulator PdtaR
MKQEGRILLVEDERLVALDVEGFLYNLGYYVTTAHNFSAASQRAARQPFDVAILDIALGGGADGIELGSLLKLRHGIPVIYLTGNDDPWLRERAAMTDPVGYLTKPYQPDLLRRLVSEALQPVDVERVA